MSAPKFKKVKLDFETATSKLMKNSDAASDDRWATAGRVLEAKPTALSPSAVESPQAASPHGSTQGELHITSLKVGQVYELPIGLLDSNPYGARFFYRAENIDKLGSSMATDTQLVPVNGFISGDRIQLYDGETRLRSAKSTGKATLSVKIDSPPVDALDQHRRSSLFNSVRSGHTHLDIAFRIKQFIDTGIYKNQEEVGEKYLGEDGSPIGAQRTSYYMRIARIPNSYLQLMSESDYTSTLTVAYAISGIFSDPQYLADPDQTGAMAKEVIKEIQDNALGTKPSIALVNSRLKGPKKRTRADIVPVKFSGTKGTLKVFPSRGQLDLSFKGLPEDKLTQLRESVEKMLSGQMAI